MNPRLVLMFWLLASLPALWTIVHGEADVDEQDAPTPDKVLRSNENVGSKTDDEVIQREEEQINPDGFSVKELQLLKQHAKVREFQTEVSKLMDIIINSLYSNREVFLRELISNASDALDKIRFNSLTDKEQLATQPKLEIKVKVDKKHRTLTITDTGIGMTKDELESNLGTIARSGTTEFINKLNNADATSNLIGQFGVGFYSAFLVADTVTVVSKNNNDSQNVWQSDAKGSFSVSEDPRGVTLGRGTSIILHLKEDAEEFLEETKLEALMKKYSEFINFPIYLWKSHEETKEVPLSEEELEERRQQKEEEESEEIDLSEEEEIPEEEEEEEVTTKTVTETVWDWEMMNETKPIWTRNPKEVTEEEYNAFYNVISKDAIEPLMHIHFLAEGEVEFKSLLYIPSTPPGNLFDPNPENQPKGVRLYVRRVFITDEFKDILPKYLAFIKGIVDSDDLPLNVSREMLQENRILGIIKKKLVRKAIAMFQLLSEQEDNTKYKQFWKSYGINIKLGLMEDNANRLRLSKLLMFHSSKTGELTTLQKYVERMKEGQTQIYYLAGESKDAVEQSPLIEQLIKRGYEVLYMVDPIDEYALANLDKFDNKYKLANIARDGVKFDGEEDDEEKEKEIKEEFAPLTDYLKSQLGGKVEKVVISKRLSTSPSALISSTYGWTANMERIVKAQALGSDAARDSPFMSPKKVMEINVHHPIVRELKERVTLDAEDSTAKDIAFLMYETAALTSGFSLEDPADFASRIVKIMNMGLNLDPETATLDDHREGKDEL